MLAAIRAFFSRLGELARKRRTRAAIDDELQCHLEMEIEQNLRHGMSPEEARRRALVALGGLQQTREDYREAWALRWLSNLVQDLRYAFRTYRRNPGFVAVVVLTLMLGIGVNVALFTVMDTLYWSAPAVHDPARVVQIRIFRKDAFWGYTYPLYQLFREHNTVLTDLTAYASVYSVSSPYGQMSGVLVSANYFVVLGGEMALGRAFSPEEGKGPKALVVVSYRTWQQRLRGDRAIVGKTIRLNGSSFTVIGVAARNFGGLDPRIPDFWAPLSMHKVLRLGSTLEDGPDGLSFSYVGRLPAGVSIERAYSALSALGYHIPSEKPIVGVELLSKAHLYQPPSAREFQKVYLPLAIALGLVLLIACANVANLLLARSATRRREIVVRLSLGASRARIVRQLFTESAILAFAGGLLSLFFAQALAAWAFSARGGTFMIPFLQATDAGVRLDFRVFLYALAVSLITSIVFGLVPALETTRFDLASAIAGSRPVFFGRTHSGPRDRLVVMQLTACLVLLIGAGLLLRSAVNARNFDLGFNLDNVLCPVVRSSVSDQDNGRLRALVVERLRYLPRVEAVSVSSTFPLRARIDLATEGHDPIRAGYNQVSPDYFRVLELPIVRGRQFTEAEVASQAPVAIISDTVAASFWPGQDPIGRRVEIREYPAPPSPPPRPGSPSAPRRKPLPRLVEVVGLTKDVRTHPPSDPDMYPPILACVYLPARVDPALPSLTLVRVTGKSASQALRNELAAVDPDAIVSVPMLTAMLESSLRLLLTTLTVAGLLGTLGLLLATVGLYGVMSYAVAQRTQEIGIRMAMGAERRNILWLVLGRGLRLAVVGALVGLALAALLSRMIAPMLYRVSRFDLLTYTLVPALLIVVCLVAAYIPARRATRLDPLVALRHE